MSTFTGNHLMSLDQARSFLGGIGRATIYERLAEGQLKSVKVGRRRMIRATDLNSYIEGLTDPVNGEAA
jgi:excisionase family DNA binding protein